MPHRLTRKDFLAVFALFSLASLVYTYPLIRNPAAANRLDSPDALLNAWIVSWDLHQLARDPFGLFDTNIFFPEENTLAYSENLLTGALLAAPIALFTDNPILVFNAVLLAGFLSTALATFLLAYDVTESRLASALAGILFAFAPYRFAHIPHLQLQLAFGLPLMLYFVRRLVEKRSPLAVAGLALTIPATFGASVYYAVYGATVAPIVAVLALMSRPAVERRRSLERLALAFGLGISMTLPLAYPYVTKLRAGSVRSLDAASQFSAGLSEYLSSFSWLHGFLPKAHEPLFPGITALVLAGGGLASPGTRRAHKASWIAIGLAGIALSMGPKLGFFSILYRVLAPYRALRVPSRAGVLFLLAVAVLAAIGLSALRRKGPKWLAWPLVVFAAAECFGGPLPLRMEAPYEPPIYRAVSGLREPGALVELPLPPPERFQDNAIYVYRSIGHFRDLVNGYSGFVPESYRRAHRLLMRRELDAGLEALSRRGVRFLLAHEGRLGPRMRRQLREAREQGLLVLLEEAPPDRLYAIVPR